jgi:hypothetical protein
LRAWVLKETNPSRGPIRWISRDSANSRKLLPLVAGIGKGVFFERSFVLTTESTKAIGGFLPFEVILKNIRKVGVGSTVLGTDFGQARNIHPVAAMKDYLQRLAEAGFKDSEIETMAVKTPMALLGD